MAKKKTGSVASALYMSEKGAIACKEHAPHEGSDTWSFDRWQAMKPAEAKAIRRLIGRKPACEGCARNVAGTEPTTVKPETEPVAGTPAPKQRKKKAKAAGEDSTITLESVCEGYLRHIEDAGKSQGTLFSYKLELVTALDEIGAKTKLADLTSARVLDFMTCQRVMFTKTGVQKAPPTFKKTRRVLRLALVWAQEAGLIEKAPLPEDAATF